MDGWLDWVGLLDGWLVYWMVGWSVDWWFRLDWIESEVKTMT